MISSKYSAFVTEIIEHITKGEFLCSFSPSPITSKLPLKIYFTDFWQRASDPSVQWRVSKPGSLAQCPHWPAASLTHPTQSVLARAVSAREEPGEWRGFRSTSFKTGSDTIFDLVTLVAWTSVTGDTNTHRPLIPDTDTECSHHYYLCEPPGCSHAMLQCYMAGAGHTVPSWQLHSTLQPHHRAHSDQSQHSHLWAKDTSWERAF